MSNLGMVRGSLLLLGLGGVFASSCQSESTIITLDSDGDSLQFSVPWDSIDEVTDTLLVAGDTVIVVVLDTVVAPGDTVFLPVVDTVVQLDTVIDPGTGDTVVVVDTVVQTSTDTILTLDTVVVTTTDTVILVDTIIQVDTVATLPPTLDFSLDTLVLDVDESATVTVTVTNVLGFPVPAQDITWLVQDALVASVDNTGLVTGQREGLTSVFAIADLEGLSATLPVSVRAEEVLPPPPPPPPPSGFNVRANEPSWTGYTRIYDRHFNSLASADQDRGSGTDPTKTGGSEGWDGIEFRNSNQEIVNTLDEGVAPEPGDDGNDRALKLTYPAGHNPGTAPATLQSQGLGGVNKLYFSSSFRYDSNFDGYGRPNKMFFFWGSGWGGGAFLSSNGDGYIPLELDFNLQASDDNARGYVGGEGAVSGTSRTIERDRWYVVEILMEMNTPGLSNGTLDVYLGSPGIDAQPVLVISLNDINWDSGGTSWSRMQLTPTYGGSGSDSIDQDGFLYVGHVNLGGAPG